jgi:chromosome segregation ATPase
MSDSINPHHNPDVAALSSSTANNYASGNPPPVSNIHLISNAPPNPSHYPTYPSTPSHYDPYNPLNRSLGYSTPAAAYDRFGSSSYGVQHAALMIDRENNRFTQPIINPNQPEIIAANKDYIERKSQQQIILINQQLNNEIKQLQEKIKLLQDESNKGKLQKQLQSALETIRQQKLSIDQLQAAQQGLIIIQQEQGTYINQIESLKNELSANKLQYETVLNELRVENSNYKEDITELELKLGAYSRESKELEEEINHNNQFIKQKDEEINKQRELIDKLRDGSEIAALEEKFHECSQLLMAREAENEVLIKSLNSINAENQELKAELDGQAVTFTRTSSNQVDVDDLNKRIDDLKHQLMLERERNTGLTQNKESLDHYIVELKSRMKDYEDGYNLTDAVQEIRRHQITIKKQEMENKQLIQDINKREKQLQHWVNENKALKVKAGVDESWGLDPNQLDLEIFIEVEKQKAIIRQLDAQINRQNSQRFELLDELRKSAVDRTEGGLIFLGLNQEKTQLLTDYAERLRQDDFSLPLNDNSYQLQQQLKSVSVQLEEWKNKAASYQLEREELMAKYIQLLEANKSGQFDSVIHTIKQLASNISNKHNHSNNDLDNNSSPINSVVTLRNSSAEHPVKPFDSNYSSLVEELAADSSVSQSFKNKFIGCVEELFAAEEKLAKNETALNFLLHNYNKLTAKQQLLFNQYYQHKQDWNKAEEINQETIKKQQKKVEELEVQLARFAPLAPTEHDDTQQLQRHNLILSVNEKVLSRRYNVLLEQFNLAQKKNNQQQTGIITMQATLNTRIAELSTSKQALLEQNRALSSSLECSISRSHYNRLSRDYQNIRHNYLNLISQQANSILHINQYKTMKHQYEQMNDDSKQMNDKLIILNEQVNRLQLELLNSQNSNNTPNHINALRSQLVSLEAKEKSAQKRVRRLEELLAASNNHLNELEEEHVALQSRAHQLNHDYLECNSKVVELKNQLEGCCSAEEVERMNQQILSLRQEREENKLHINHYREIAEITKNQCKEVLSLEGFQYSESNQAKLAALDQVINDLQTQSDDSAIIGKLHIQLLNSKWNEKQAKDELAQAQQLFAKLNSQSLSLEKSLDERNSELFNFNKYHREKVNSLELEIIRLSELQSDSQFSMAQAEGLFQSNQQLTIKVDAERQGSLQLKQLNQQLQLRVDQLQSELLSQAELNNAMIDGEVWKKQLQQAKLYSNLNELDFNIEFSSSSQEEHLIRMKKAVAAWNGEIKSLRLRGLQLDHELNVCNNRVQFFAKQQDDNEQLIGKLQQELVEKQQLISKKELQFKEKAAQLKEQEEQLRIATNFKALNQEIQLQEKSGAAVAAASNNQQEQLLARLASAENLISSQRNEISELTQKFSLLNNLSSVQVSKLTHAKDLSQAEQAKFIETAQLSISSLQAQLQEKNNRIVEYQNLIEKLNHKQAAKLEQYEIEISQLNAKLATKDYNNIQQINAALNQLDNKPNLPNHLIPAEQVKQILEEKDQQIKQMNAELELITLHLNKANQDYSQLLSSYNTEKEQLLNVAAAAEEELSIFKSNATHSEKARAILDKLKKDLNDKEATISSLNAAIIELKTEILANAGRLNGSTLHSHDKSVNEKEVLINRLAKQLQLNKSLKLEYEKLKSAHDHLAEEKSSARFNLIISELKEQILKQSTELIEQQKNLSGVQQQNDELKLRVRELKREGDKKINQIKEEQNKELLDREAKRRLLANTNTAKLEAEKKALQDKINELHNIIKNPGNEIPSREQKQNVAAVHPSSKFKSKQLEELHATIHALTNKLRKENKDKLELLNKIQELQNKKVDKHTADSKEETAAAAVVAAEVQAGNLVGKDLDHLESVEEYRRKIFSLEEEILTLNKVIQVDDQAQIIKLQSQCKRLEEQLQQTAGNSSGKTVAAEVLNSLQRVSSLELELLELTEKNLEMKFEVENSEINMKRLKKRLAEVEHINSLINSSISTDSLPLLMQDMFGSAESVELSSLAVQKKDLSSILNTFKKLIEKLKAENDMLKKNSHTNLDYMALIKENKSVKKKLEHVLLECSEKENDLQKRFHQVSIENDRIANILTQQRKENKKETELNSKLKKKNEELHSINSRLTQQVIELEKEIDKLNQLLINNTANSERANVEKVNLEYLTQIKQQEIELSEQKGLISKLQVQSNNLTALIEQLQSQSAAQSHTQSAESSSLLVERERLLAENAAYKQELSAFDVEFFEEIEDLKYRYQQAVTLIKQFRASKSNDNVNSMAQEPIH